MPPESKKSRTSASSQGNPRRHAAAERPSKAEPIPRKWVFRLGSMILLPIVAVLAFELVLRLIGYGYETSFFVRTEIAGRKVLVPNEKFGWRFFGPALARTARPMEIPAVKPPRTCRVFV